MYLTQALHRALQRCPDRSAYVCDGQRRSFADVHDRVARLGAVLDARGVQPGDRVALLAGNATETIEAFLGCWWIGAVPCPVNTRWSVPEMVFALRDCEPRMLLVDAAHAALLAPLREAGACPQSMALGGGHGPDAPPGCEPAMRAVEPRADGRWGGEHLAALLYTGGTTGRSKGVMLSHANLWSSAMGRLADVGPMEDAVALLVTPLFHVAAISRFLPHLLAGSTVVVLPRFDPAEVIALIEREKVTDLPVVPSMLQRLLDDPAFVPERLRSLRRLSYGAAPSAEALLRRAQALLPWAGLTQSYGMTESSSTVVISTPADHDEAGWRDGRARAAGRACTVVELRVADEQGLDVAPGEVGEILLRGPTVMQGYWNRPEETAAALRDGWLRTGDAGRLAPGGHLHVVDRIKDMIVTGGENVYSAEVENVLALHPAVSMCAVIGAPDPLWGEAVRAVVVLRPGVTVDDAALVAYCRRSLAGYKCPKRIDFVDALPLTAAGKVAKNRLREALRDGGPPAATHGEDPT